MVINTVCVRQTQVLVTELSKRQFNPSKSQPTASLSKNRRSCINIVTVTQLFDTFSCQCATFKENSRVEKQSPYILEIDLFFPIVYLAISYHFVLLRCYGSIVTQRSAMGLCTTLEILSYELDSRLSFYKFYLFKSFF